MPSQYETKLYDLHLLFEAGYDDVPVIRAYSVVRNANGEIESDTSGGNDDRYDYTQEDCDWILANLSQQVGYPYEEIGDFYSDEWFSSDDLSQRELLPPNAVEWIKHLEPYLMTDYSADVREAS
jgi:hypothetical protein